MCRLTPLLAVVAASLAPRAARAHAGETDGGLAWSLDPWVVAGLALCAAVYGVAISRTVRGAGRGQLFSNTRRACFVAAMAALTAALLSPLDVVAVALFSVHMVQHLLLMLIAAPLLVASALPLAALWALPPPARRGLARWWSGSHLQTVTDRLVHPLSIWLLYAAVFLFWHVPGPYRWAVQSDVVHSLEHLSILLAGFLFWTVVIGPPGAPRLDHGARLLFIATAAVLGGLPGALMILSPRAFYTVHAEAAAAWDLTPLEDQQLAGLIMWIPGGLIYLAAASVVFLRWLHSAEHRARSAQARLLGPASRGGMALLLLTVLVACGEDDRRSAGAGIGDPEAGEEEIAAVGCGACHIIPGIDAANGLVGPPLNHMGRRVYIAGLLRNTPENMVYWLQNPQEVVPGNAMPDMQLSDQQARDIAAYLYTLQ